MVMSSCSSSADSESSSQVEPPDPDAIEIDPTRRYVRYKDVLGKGAFKTVYKAFDEVDGIEVAWNQMKIEEVTQSLKDPERLCSEIKLLKLVKHENIVKFYASWIDDENKTINIITELFTSGSLRQYRRKHKMVDMKAVKGWARQILAGLDYLHSQKPPIIHRDLKCDNIFINGNNGEVKIGDLGLATIMHKANGQTVIGTPEFMAPELYDEEYNELVDIYSFGMCMLEMVTFEYPYSECNNSAQIFKKVSTGVKPAALSKVKDLEVKAFIEKCLVPACHRLPARELLSDSFLCFDGCIETQHNLFSPSSSIESLKRDCCEVPPLSRQGNSVKVLYTSSDDIRIPITFTCEIRSSNQHLKTLEVEAESKEKRFRLRGNICGIGSISFILWIQGQKGCVKTEFSFNIGSDTSSSVATEIVEYFNLATEDVQFIECLIDSLFQHLIPEWQAHVSINHTINACQDDERSSRFFITGGDSFGSFHSSSEATVSLGREFCTDSVIDQVDDTLSVQAGPNILKKISTSLSCFESDALISDSSFCSALPSLENSGNSSGVIGAFMCCPSNQIDCNGYEMTMDMDIMLSKSEISLHHNQRDRDLDIWTLSDASTFSDLCSNDSSDFVDKADVDKSEVDEELMLELEVLELHFQLVMDYISDKRQQAIAAAKKRATERTRSIVEVEFLKFMLRSKVVLLKEFLKFMLRSKVVLLKATPMTETIWPSTCWSSDIIIREEWRLRGLRREIGKMHVLIY